MADEGEKTCPLCAEEMDLTDQHLKPCRCGYQICVWCWHHIIEMAEKDETEGRCPACRTPYDKEKIVGMAVKCERLVAEVSMEQKKPQKAKPKASEGRKQLSNVRVIQRNLVYVVGLPLDLADEDLLHRKEYFGQYGKVLKVSMTRTAAGIVQQFPNNTCSVYITYSKEDEAIRCIQSVHGFVLDGRLLKACFGTTKYCHAWVRNMHCTNPDCLYLHEVGSQEDSFTKDEVISAYMRSKVQQITGATNNMQRRAGSMLPPPADEYRPNPKVAPNNPQSMHKSVPPNGSTRRSVTLPAGASWGMHSSSQPPLRKSECLSEPLKGMPGIVSSTVSSTMSASHSDKNSALEQSQSLRKHAKHELSTPLDVQTDLPENPSLLDKTQITNKGALVSATVDDSGVSEPSNSTDSLEHTSQSSVSSNAASMTTEKGIVDDHIGVIGSDSSHMEVSQQLSAEESWEVLALQSCGDSFTSRTNPEIKENTSFNEQRVKDPEVSRPANVASTACSSLYKTEIDPNTIASTLASGGSDGLDKARETKPNGKLISKMDESIIETIMSLDIEDILASPRNMAKLLEAMGEEARSLRLLRFLKLRNNQSRFSFAREEESRDRAFGSYSVINQMPSGSGFHHDSTARWDSLGDKLAMFNGLSSSYLNGFDSITGNSFPKSSISVPPGFSVRSQSPPPSDFSLNGGRTGHAFSGVSGNGLLESTLLRNPYQSPPVEYMNDVGDIELMDPAIMAVGQGRVQGGRGFENASLDLRSSFLGNQSLRFTGLEDRMASRLIEQSQGSSLASSLYAQLSHQQSSNGHYSNGMADFQRGRLGFNYMYGNYEGSSIQMPSSGGMYNRSFRN